MDHDYEFAKGAYKWRLLERNRSATVLRTYPAPLLALLAPALLATELALLVFAARVGLGAGEAAAPRRHAAGAAAAAARAARDPGAAGRSARASSRGCCTPELSSPDLGPLARNRLLRAALRAYWARAALSVIR